MPKIVDVIKRHRNKRRAFRFVESVIGSGKVNIQPCESTRVTAIPGCEDIVESYDLYSLGGNFFACSPRIFDKDLAVISLVKVDGPFFTDYSLEFNHTDLELSERKVHWLFDRVNALKMQQQNNATVQAM